MVTSPAWTAPAMPLDSSERFAEWAGTVCRAHGVSDRTISAMVEGIKEDELDGEMLRQGGPEDLELREGMRLPELPAIGERRRKGHAARVLDGLAWRLLHAAGAGRGRHASAVELKAWVRRMLPGCDGVSDVVECLGVAVRELLPSEAGLLVPGECGSSGELLARLGRMLACLRSAAGQGCGLPDTESNVTVCVIGNTGAGKSTLLNSLLGEESLLPTNAMRACTAAIIEIVYNFDFSADSRSYMAEIRFIPKEEWKAFVLEAFQVLLREGGVDDQDEEMEEGAEKEEDSESLKKQMKSKLYAAYGKGIDLDAGPEALLQKRGAINDNLGKVVMLRAASGRELREKYEQYVDSSNEASEGATWPIVQRVVLKGPWDLLCSGLRLVDAPGLQDDNSARDQVVKSYMRQADSLWLVSNIRRATNDKTTMDMMPAGFIQVLKDEGVPGSLAYIATQTDVMLRSEVIQNLPDRLSETSTQLECALARNNFFKETMVEKFTRAQEGSHDLDKMRDAPEKHGGSQEGGRFEFMSFAVSAVDYQKIKGIRKGDGEPSVFRDEQATEIPRLQDFVLQCAPRLREAKFKAGCALLDYLVEAKARAAREEVEALVELDMLKNYRAKFQEALDKVHHADLRMSHGGLLSLTAHAQTTILSLSVSGAGTIGLPLCAMQAAQLEGMGNVWEGLGGRRASVVEGGRVTLSSGMRGLVLEAARKGAEGLGLVALARIGVQYALSSLIVGERGVPFAAMSGAAQGERAFGRMVLQLPSFYDSGGEPSVRVAHGEASQSYDWGGIQSGESFFSVATFSQCAIDISPPCTPASGRGLFLVFDLVQPASVPDPLPRIADNSEAAVILRNAVRGMLRDKCEAIGIALSKGLEKRPRGDTLVGKNKAVLQLMMEQTQLEVGFAVIQMTRSEATGLTSFYSGSLQGVDGKGLGFSVPFDIGQGQDGKVLCKDIVSASQQGQDNCLFAGVRQVPGLNQKRMSQRVSSRVVLVIWPRESTLQLLIKQGRTSSMLKCLQECVRSKDLTAAQALQAVAERFTSASQKAYHIPDAGEVATLLQLFADSGGLAVEAVCLVIKSLPAIVARFPDRIRSADISKNKVHVNRSVDVTLLMREALLRIVAVFGWEGVRGSFEEFARGLMVRQINEHVISVASALAHQGFVEFESALLQRLVIADADSLRAMQAVGATQVIKIAFSEPRHALVVTRLGASLKHLPSQGLRAAFEDVFAKAFPKPAPVTLAARQLASGALSSCKQLARAILQQGAHYSVEKEGSMLVMAVVRLNDWELSALCLQQLTLPARSSKYSTSLQAVASPTAIRERMLSDFLKGLLLGSTGVSSAVEALGPCLRGLRLQAAHHVFTTLRAAALLEGSNIEPFTRLMFKRMRDVASEQLEWTQVQGLLEIVLPSSGAVRAGDGITAGVIDDFLGVFFTCLKFTGQSGNAPVVDLVKRLQANGVRCHQHLSGLAATVRRNVTADTFATIFISVCTSPDAPVREMISDFARPYLDATADMCQSLQGALLGHVCALFCSSPHLSQHHKEGFFEKLLPIAREAWSSSPPSSHARPAEESAFIPSLRYVGGKAGFAFKMGDHGLGYYKDAPTGVQNKVPKPTSSPLAKIFENPVVRESTSKHILELAEMRLAELKSSSTAQKPAVIPPGTFSGCAGDFPDRIGQVNSFLQSNDHVVFLGGFINIHGARSWAGQLSKMTTLRLVAQAHGSGRGSQVRVTKAGIGHTAQLLQHEENLKDQNQIASVIGAMRKRFETEAAARRAPVPRASAEPAPAPPPKAPPPQAAGGHYGLRSVSGGAKRAAAETPDTVAKKRKKDLAAEVTKSLIELAGALPTGVAGAGAGAGGPQAAQGGDAPAAAPNPPQPMVIDLTDD